jgi:hypothetical protein
MTATPSRVWPPLATTLYRWLALTSDSSQSHVTTHGQSAGQSWCQAPSRSPDQIFITVSCGFVDVGRLL